MSEQIVENAPVRKREPVKLVGIGAELLEIAELAVKHSDGRLRIAYNEKDDTSEFDQMAEHFLKFDGQRLGDDLELYAFFGESKVGWDSVLPRFFEEYLLSIRNDLPESYTNASLMLCALGSLVYEDDILKRWHKLFESYN